MSRAVAFEGPDLTGKTTLLDALQKRMPYAMWPLLSVHSSKVALREPGGVAVNAAGWAFYSSIAVMARTMSVLLDRCYVTNYVYGRVFGREVDGGAFLCVAASLQPVVVYVYTPLELLLERLKWRGDDFVDAELLKKVYDGYETWYVDNPFVDEVVRIRSDGASSIGALVDEIDSALREKL